MAAGFEILNDNSNLIEGNYVGLDITGMSAVPNLIQGIQIVGSNDNTVGGAAAGSGNVISGNRDNATAGQQLVINDENLSTQTASGNLVQGNLIGTNAAGTGLPSGMSFDYDGTGVNIIGCAAGNTIGGTLAGSANVIAGNATGVFIGSVGFLAGGTTSGNVVDGNDIGVEANGTTALANTVGVLIQSGVGNSLTDDNTIGGATAAAANLISGNTTLGIEISGSTATGNVVAGDYIGTDLNGMVAIANATGVELDTGASGNTIGGLTAARHRGGQRHLGQHEQRRRDRRHRHDGQRRRGQLDWHRLDRHGGAGQPHRRCLGRHGRHGQLDRRHHGVGPQHHLRQRLFRPADHRRERQLGRGQLRRHR